LKEETQQTMASQSEAMAWSAAWDDECAPEALPPVSAQALQRWHDYAQIGHAMRRNQAQPAGYCAVTNFSGPRMGGGAGSAHA